MPAQRHTDTACNLAGLALAVKLTVSGNLLLLAGIPYSLPGGALVTKIHPGSYLAALAMLAKFAAIARRRQGWFGFFCRHGDITLYVGALGFCVTYGACMTGTGGLIALLDTFLPAGLIAFAMSGARQEQLADIRRLLCALFFLNAVLAIGESLAGERLVTMPDFGAALPPGAVQSAEEFRPTALYDHPLTGAAATMLGLILRAPQSAPRAVARAYYGVLFTALVAFGGRTALLLFMLGSIAAFGWALWRRLLCRHLRWNDIVSLLMAPAGCAAIFLMSAYTGMAARLQAHFYWDDSAQSRVDVIRVLGRMSAAQLAFGCRRNDWLALIEPLRLSYRVTGIENCWLLMLVTLGGLCFPVFLVGIAALLRGLWRAGDTQGRLMIATMLIVVSTSNSLGRKSILLMLLVGCVVASGQGWRLAGRSGEAPDHAPAGLGYAP